MHFYASIGDQRVNNGFTIKTGVHRGQKFVKCSETALGLQRKI
jgi:hypothetical protein